MSRPKSWTLLGLLIAALFVGTLMSDALRQEFQRASHSPFALSSWAHFVVFAALAWHMKRQPLGFGLWRVMVIALALALLSEGLQFLTPDRHPRWIDVGIDMAGALLGLALACGLGAVWGSRRA